MRALAKPADSMLGNLADEGILASLTYRKPECKSHMGLRPLLVSPDSCWASTVCQRAQYVSSALSFQTPIHSTCLPLDFPDVHSFTASAGLWGQRRSKCHWTSVCWEAWVLEMRSTSLPAGRELELQQPRAE